MSHSTFRAPYRRLQRTFLLALLALAGCGTQGEIRHYRVPKPELVYAGNHVDAPAAETSERPAAPRGVSVDPSDRLAFEIPSGWARQAPVPLSSLTLGLSEGDRSAQITVSSLKGDGGGLLANVNRWNRQVDLPPLTEGQLAEKTEPLTVGGIPGSYVEAVSDANPSGGKAVLGWIGLQEQQSWFVKMSGNTALVRDQRGTFRRFLETLKFNAP